MPGHQRTLREECPRECLQIALLAPAEDGLFFVPCTGWAAACPMRRLHPHSFAAHEVVPLGISRARRAMDIAVKGRLGGADAVYVRLASSRHLPLCTLDDAMAERAEAFCKVLAP